MRLVAKKAELELNTDPRPMDRVIFNRLKLMVEHEACHPAWGCALYRLHRLGRIDNDQREAGDKFAMLASDYKKVIHEPLTDVLGVTNHGEISMHRQTGSLGKTQDLIASAWAENLREKSELEQRRDERTTRRYKEAASVAGSALSVLEALLLEDVWPVGERGQLAISHALTRLAHFFTSGTKRKR